jgi:hypothetical protein
MGFPGIWVDRDEIARGYLAFDSLGPLSLPGLRWIGQAYASLLRATTASFVALRGEEHAGFLETVLSEGTALGMLVDEGRLPVDTYVPR